MAEEADLDDPREHLDASQKPISGESGAVSHPFESRAAARTVCGFFMISSGKGASMIKLPLSETTGPAFALAIRRDALGEPMRCRFCRIFVYANGTTSMGIP